MLSGLALKSSTVWIVVDTPRLKSSLFHEHTFHPDSSTPATPDLLVSGRTPICCNVLFGTCVHGSHRAAAAADVSVVAVPFVADSHPEATSTTPASAATVAVVRRPTEASRSGPSKSSLKTMTHSGGLRFHRIRFVRIRRLETLRQQINGRSSVIVATSGLAADQVPENHSDGVGFAPRR